MRKMLTSVVLFSFVMAGTALAKDQRKLASTEASVTPEAITSILGMSVNQQNQNSILYGTTSEGGPCNVSIAGNSSAAVQVTVYEERCAPKFPNQASQQFLLGNQNDTRVVLKSGALSEGAIHAQVIEYFPGGGDLGPASHQVATIAITKDSTGLDITVGGHGGTVTCNKLGTTDTYAYTTKGTVVTGANGAQFGSTPNTCK